jgi:hypothetical protein
MRSFKIFNSLERTETIAQILKHSSTPSLQHNITDFKVSRNTNDKRIKSIKNHLFMEKGSLQKQARNSLPSIVVGAEGKGKIKLENRVKALYLDL